MDLWLGTKRIKSICKGSKYIPGLMVNGRLWHGSPGSIFTASETASGVIESRMDKVYYGNGELFSVYKHVSFLRVCSGGKMYDGDIGFLSVENGGYVKDIGIPGKPEPFDWGDFGSGVLHIPLPLHVSSGGTAVNVDVGYGQLTVSSGGIASNITTSDAMTVSAYDHSVTASSVISVCSGGTALNVTSRTGAKIIVESGGYITYA